MSLSSYLLRVILAPAIGIPLAFLGAQLLPGAAPLQDQWVLAIGLSLLGLLLVRHAIVLPLVGTLLPHRVLVLGTGPEARLVEASLTSASPLGMRLVGFYALEKMQETVVSPSRVIARGGPLEETVRQLGIDEIIVAVRQQRGGVLPLRALLDCRLDGVQVTDLARYFERVHGQVPIESLKVSWLIYGHGFRQNALRSVRQAMLRSRRLGGADRLSAADRRPGRAAHRRRRRRPGHLPAGARRLSRPHVHRAQAAQHAAATPRRTARRRGRRSTIRA